MDENLVLIVNAILNRHQISFKYDGQPRTVNPHLIGLLGGELQLHAFQISNGSNSEEVKGWKNFKIKDIRNINVLPIFFSPERTYNAENANYSLVIKKI